MPKKINREMQHQESDGMSELGVFLLSKLPAGDAGVAGRTPKHTTSYSERNPEVCREPRDNKRPSKTSNNKTCHEVFRRPPREDDREVVTIYGNEGQYEASQTPAPCNESPVSLPSKDGRHEAFQRPCNMGPVTTISTDQGVVKAPPKPACPEPTWTPKLRPGWEVRNFACNRTPPGTFPKPTCDNSLKKPPSSNRGHPVAYQETFRGDKGPANIIHNTRADPGAVQIPSNDKHQVNTSSRTQCTDKNVHTSLSCNKGRHGGTRIPQCRDKHPITLTGNKGYSEASWKPIHGHGDDRRPVNTPWNERSTQATRITRPVHNAYSNKRGTEDSRTLGSKEGPARSHVAAHKLGDQRPVSTIPSSDGCLGDYTPRGETRHVEKVQTKARAEPQNTQANTNFTDRRVQRYEICKFWGVSYKFRWFFRYPKFQRELQRSFMVETLFSNTKRGMFVRGKTEDVLACISYLNAMVEQWRQRDMRSAAPGPYSTRPLASDRA